LGSDVGGSRNGNIGFYNFYLNAFVPIIENRFVTKKMVQNFR